MKRFFYFGVSTFLGTILLCKLFYEFFFDRNNVTKKEKIYAGLQKCFLLLCIVLPFGFFILGICASFKARKTHRQVA